VHTCTKAKTKNKKRKEKEKKASKQPVCNGKPFRYEGITCTCSQYGKWKMENGNKQGNAKKNEQF